MRTIKVAGDFGLIIFGRLDLQTGPSQLTLEVRVAALHGWNFCGRRLDFGEWSTAYISGGKSIFHRESHLRQSLGEQMQGGWVKAREKVAIAIPHGELTEFLTSLVSFGFCEPWPSTIHILNDVRIAYPWACHSENRSCLSLRLRSM